MGNLFTNESNIEVDDIYLHNLRKWESKIKNNNLNRNGQTNNGPDYVKDLKSWSDNIKMNNFIRNNNTNNPPDSIKELHLRNQYLESELVKLNTNFTKVSIL
jgi:hypothetical protein